MARKRILIITNMYPDSERKYFGIFVRQQVDSLIKCDKHDVDVVVLKKGSNPFMRLYSLLTVFFTTLLRIITKKVDVIHVHYGLTGIVTLLLWPAIKLFDVRVVVTFHGSDILGSNKLAVAISRVTSNLSDLNVAVSKEIYESLPVATRKIWLPCGVDDSFITDYADNVRDPIVIFPSSPSRPEKDYKRFLTIINKVEDILGRKVETICLENLSSSEIANIFHRSCCLLMTSKYEGSPQTIKEAILSYMPIASTDVGDVRYIVDGIDYACVSNDDDSLADFVVKMLCEGPSSKYPDSFRETYLSSAVAGTLSNLYIEV